MLLISKNFPKYTFLLYFALQQYAVHAAWRQSQSAYNARGDDERFQFRWFKMNRNSLEKFCKMNNRERFRRLLEPILVQRIVGTKSHREVAGYLARTLSALGFTIDWDRFSEKTPYGVIPFETLIATYDPRAPRRLLLACHYDSKILKGEVFIGATDSAVPCAMLLEMAFTLGPLLARRKRKDVTLQLVFFDGEEALEEWTATDSIYGARHLSMRWRQEYYPTIYQSSFEIQNELDRIDLFVLLDLLGAPNPFLYNFEKYSTKNAFTQLLRIEEALRDIRCLHPLQPIFQPLTVSSEVEDDHLPFLEHGVPILHLIPLPFPNVWHKASDNATVLNYETIDNLNSVLRVFIARYLGLVP